jgi:phytoene dehydrogenase-like protein
MAAEKPPSAPGPRWLVVGHGSVGSFLAARIARAGQSVQVLDPNPRIPLSEGAELVKTEAGTTRFDRVASCVPPDAAESVPRFAGELLERDGFFFDWNTCSPLTKRRIEQAVTATVADVALLDSLDASVELPILATSGPRGAEAADILRALGFTVAEAGEEVGQAAALKYLRSLFMKTLEALVLEHASLSAALDRNSIVRDSIANNLGPAFVDFMDLLLRTNRVHAQRRSSELADAVATLADGRSRLQLASAGVDVLRRSAQAWGQPAAPPPGSDTDELANYLHEVLWDKTAST